MKYILLIVSIYLISFQSYGSHVVGGDFRITMTNNIATGAYYNFQLRLFRDDVNGLATMPTSAPVGIYEIGTNALVANVTLYQANLSLVNLGDPCYTPDPNIVRIQEGIFQNNTPILLPNNPNGYYIQYEIFARNAIVTNIFDPGNTGMGIFAMFPDPSLGQNSSPDFGIYPADAYFCINENKVFNFPVSDPDGDSLVYSFVTPLKSITDQFNFIPGGSTQPGSGSYPYYPECTWATSYSLNNIIGGSPSMTINPNNGIISASPSIQNFFVYTVRVEEFRNGTKIGEVRRDVQYASLGCTVNNPPTISVNNSISNPTTNAIDVGVYVDDSICLDLQLSTSDSNDSLYLNISSNEFDLLGTYIQPSAFINSSSALSTCDYILTMLDSYGDGWNGAFVDISVNGITVVSGATGANMGGVGNGGPCGTESITINNGDIISLTNWVSGTYDSEISWNISDANGTIVSSGIHGDVPSITSICNNSSNSTTNLAYFNWENNTLDTAFFNQFTLNQNGYIGSQGNIYMRYCWEAPCEGVDSSYLVSIDAYTVDCSGINDTQTELNVIVLSKPQSTDIDVPSQITVSYNEEMCIDLYAKDSTNSTDTLFLETASANFNIQGSFIFPDYDSTLGLHYFNDFQDTIGKTVYMQNYYHNGNVSSAIQQVALRYCWVTDCEYVFQKEFDINYTAFSSVCGSSTVEESSHVEVEEPLSNVEDIPNIFTPNDDGDNDFYQLAGQNDPCYDLMDVSIYNRWGQLVYSSDDSNFKWDGKNKQGAECNNGTYLVIIDGSYGSTYDTNGVRQPILIKDEYWIHLNR